MLIIALSKELADYDFAVYTGSRARSLKTSKDEVKLSKGEVFGYRDGRGDSVYLVIQNTGLKKEFRISGPDFDKYISDKADPLTRAKAKKLFETPGAKPSRPSRPPAPPIVTPKPRAEKKVSPPVEPKVAKELGQDSEESKAVHAFGDKNAWRRVSGREGQLAYIRAVWNNVNHKECGNQLQVPNFRMQKDMGANFKRRGSWAAGRRLMTFSPRLFVGEEKLALLVIVHEIAHQAVSEIDRVVDRTEAGHGFNWQKWMRKFGLTPSRYDKIENIEYMDPVEKAKHLKIRDKHEEFKQAHVQLSPWDVSENTVVLLFDTRTGTYTPGIICCPHDQARKRWAVATTLSGAFMIYPPALMYKASEADVNRFKDQMWLNRVESIKHHYDSRRQVRAQVREAKRLWMY